MMRNGHVVYKSAETHSEPVAEGQRLVSHYFPRS